MKIQSKPSNFRNASPQRGGGRRSHERKMNLQAGARYLGWTPGQYLSVLSTLVGVAILTYAFRRGPDKTAPTAGAPDVQA